MCGRFTIFADPDRLAERFQAELPAEGLEPRYNAAPTQKLPVILNDEPSTIQLLRWGLIPFWAKDPSIGSRLINARADTMANILENPNVGLIFMIPGFDDTLRLNGRAWIERDPAAAWKIAAVVSIALNLLLIVWVLFLPR